MQELQQHGRQGWDDKDAHRSARPEEEDIHQGEGRTGLALLGTVRPRLQDGNPPRSLRAGQEEQRRPGHRWQSPSRPSRKAAWRVFSSRFRTNWSTHVSADAGAEEGDTEGRGQRSAFSGFLPSATAWFRERSSSSWNRSSKLISNRGRLAIDRSGQLMKRYNGWQRLSSSTNTNHRFRPAGLLRQRAA